MLYPQDIRTALEIIAYTFIRNNLFEYYFILIGSGGNGKSVFIGILSNLHGHKNISNVPLHSLVSNRFALADLENKDVNVDTELSSSTINDMSILKKLTGRQPIRIERKGQHAYDALLWAKQFFNAINYLVLLITRMLITEERSLSIFQNNLREKMRI